jgi:hypothetical protein
VLREGEPATPVVEPKLRIVRPELLLTEDEGEPVSPPLDLEGNERTASRPTDSRTREVAPDAPDPVDRETAPPSRDGDETTRPEEAPLSREGKLRTPAAPELLPAGGRDVPRSTTRR